MEQIKHIPLERLHPPEFDNRLSSSPIDDDDLRDSIRELGILLPLIVKEATDGYEIIAGNRRRKEAGRAGLRAAPCVVVKTDEAAAEKIKIHENLKRLPLSHVDQAFTFAHLIKKFKMTEQQVGVLTGYSIAYVSQHLSLLSCDDALIQAVHDGRINFSVARELVKCKDEDERTRLANIVEENGASVAVVNSWVKEANRETDNLDHPLNTQKNTSHPSEYVVPLYPCAVCNTPIDAREIKMVRMCPDCHYGIFSSIEHERMKQRATLNGKPT